MEKIKAEASGFIYEAAKHADKENYSLALNDINKAISKIHRLSPEICSELSMVRKAINARIVSKGDEDVKRDSNGLGDWLEKIAQKLYGYSAECIR